MPGKGRPKSTWTHGVLPIRHEFHPEWEPLFDQQIEVVRSDIRRNRDEDKLIAYLSCPISSRGGGYSATNLEIAAYTAQRVMAHWGTRCWVLNPGQYQMESAEGVRLMERHLDQLRNTEAGLRTLEEAMGSPERALGVRLNDLPPAEGGDYMRMWTTVLAGEDGQGRQFDFYYFLAASDVWDFFTLGGGRTVTAGVEEYFARKTAIDHEFSAYFGGSRDVPQAGEQTPAEELERRRAAFFRFYAVRASIAYSKGSHDEWNIWVHINKQRLTKAGVGDQLPGYWEGRQIDPAASETPVSKGYEL
jgi:hypothetical protein